MDLKTTYIPAHTQVEHGTGVTQRSLKGTSQLPGSLKKVSQESVNCDDGSRQTERGLCQIRVSPQATSTSRGRVLYHQSSDEQYLYRVRPVKDAVDFGELAALVQ
ncbi:hypothetical protein Pcinc_036571 [Petrolisthes cinctipes]|uniref:Uncharacterized protein n=1 Tax=Petrolisthes cinctipes TaxID=88211 RepID=A0AAE1BVE5_PETCI|nr:hypothetical protein Pcinc_036571 [Petrolisthes cinctipes]